MAIENEVDEIPKLGSDGEELFTWQLKTMGAPAFVREYRWHDKRKWKFDFAWLELEVAVEIEGGTYSGGRHTRGVGFRSDCVKYNSATLAGWRVFRFPTEMVNSGEAMLFMEDVLCLATGDAL